VDFSINGFWREKVGCMDWIVLAEDRDKQQALVNTVMNFRVP
jgi:hypothetical protein